MSAAQFRRLLEVGDVDGIRAAWHSLFPSMPQPETRDQAEIAMHMARTATESLPDRLRIWSHDWLTERQLPSQLPARLQREKIMPSIAKAVGISVNARNPFLAPAMLEVRGAMEQAVLEADADKRIADVAHVSKLMREARERTMRALFGR